MTHNNQHPRSTTKQRILLASIALCTLATGCSKSLNSLDGPTEGRVSGLVCNKLPTLTAALEMPITQSALISEGHCIQISRSTQVDVIRTVMMPADGKYSQFEISVKGKTEKMWIQTAKIRV